MHILLIEPCYGGSHRACTEAATYACLLWQGDVAVSTALHESFGTSEIEAVYW